MTEVTGDDRGWESGGYGVLGTGTPRTTPSQGGPENVDSYGVWGLLGTPGDVANIVDRITNLGRFGALQRTAVLGRNALPDQGTAIYGESRANESTVADAFGFIAGRSPFAGEVTGVFGQGLERGMIGIAGAGGGIGVYGGSVGGSGTGVFGDAGDHQVGVIGRSSGLSGVGVQAINSGGGLAGLFLGRVRVEGNTEVGGVLSVNGQDLLALIQQLAQQISEIPGQTNFGVPVSRPARPHLIPSTSGTTVTINGQGFTPGAQITLHHSHTEPSNTEETTTGIFPFVFNLEAGDHMTAEATDGTRDAFDNTGFSWSTQITVNV